MTAVSFRSLIHLAVVLSVYGITVLEIKQVKQTKSICSWNTGINVRKSKCSQTEKFQCINSNNCISRGMYCDGDNDCGDNSDERYCNTDPCPTNPLFLQCESSRKCIPYEWICNGKTDCPLGEDEQNCSSYSRFSAEEFTSSDTLLQNVFDWLTNQKIPSSDGKWGPNLDIFALIFHFANRNSTHWLQNQTKMEFLYELHIQLLSRLMSTGLDEIPTTELASFVNAFLVMCINPRNFHGYDIIQELRKKVDQENYTNPYVLLALCNAGETITEADKNKLIDTFENKRRSLWTDMQAVAVMALACAKRQTGNEVNSDTLRNMTLELKQQQYKNGSVVNLPTTALVLQALIATDSDVDPDSFNATKAFLELLRNQKSDGSFGGSMSTLLITPVLTCRSFVDINSDHCHKENRDETSALENLLRRSGPKIQVQYSLWFGNDKDLSRNLVLGVPQNASLYRLMEIAAEVDSRFEFEYSVKNHKPYVISVSKMRDNPLTGKFWFLYTVENGNPTLCNKSPADIIPKDNDHYVMWYRRGTWVE